MTCVALRLKPFGLQPRLLVSLPSLHGLGERGFSWRGSETEGYLVLTEFTGGKRALFVKPSGLQVLPFYAKKLSSPDWFGWRG